MAPLSRRQSGRIDQPFGKRTGRRIEKNMMSGLAEAAAIQASKADVFDERYGQAGKAPGYADELAKFNEMGPEAMSGTVYKSWLRRKSISFDPNDPGVMIRRKRRANGTTEKYVRKVPGSEQERGQDGKPKVYVSRIVKRRGDRKLIDTSYDSNGKLETKLKSKSGGRRKERWERDSKGRLIRTEYSTNRLRDGIFFRSVSEEMSGLNENGKRILIQRKGRLEKRFERDEATGELTLTGRKGYFGAKSISLKPDGSLHKTLNEKGIFKTEVEYLGKNSKRITKTGLFGRVSIRTVKLTDHEKEQQQRRRDEKTAAAKRTTPLVAPADSGITPVARTDSEITLVDPGRTISHEPAPNNSIGIKQPSSAVASPEQQLPWPDRTASEQPTSGVRRLGSHHANVSGNTNARQDENAIADLTESMQASPPKPIQRLGSNSARPSSETNDRKGAIADLTDSMHKPSPATRPSTPSPLNIARPGQAPSGPTVQRQPALRVSTPASPSRDGGPQPVSRFARSVAFEPAFTRPAQRQAASSPRDFDRPNDRGREDSRSLG